MGNNRFRLSHVMPNTWFYKLRDMGMGMARSGRSTSSAQKRFIRDPPRKIRSPESAIRRSFELAQRGPPLRYVQKPAADFGYGFSGMTQDGGFQSQPRRQKSFRKNSSLVGSPVSAGCSCRTSVVSTKKPKDKDSDEELQSRRGRMKMQMPSKHVLQYGFNNVAGLPSPVNGDEEEEEEGPEKEEFVEVTETVTKRPCQCKDCAENGSSFPSSSASYSPSGVSVSSETENQPSVEEPRKPARRIRTRIGSPRPRSLKPKETQKAATGKKNSQKQSAVLPRGFAVVKRSYDPEKDFKESMIEMILQNDLTSYKDLLRLLECYLSLNSKEYHKTIVEVFQQVWLDLIPFPKA